jgi:hypothetical protein
MARLAIILLALLFATSSASAADTVLVVLADEKGETSIHYQHGVPHKDCMYLLAEWRRLMRKGEKMALHFKTPPVTTGTVVEVSCILPDGSVHAEDKAPNEPLGGQERRRP